RDGRDGLQYIKRFAVTGVSRDKEYDLTQGKPGSRITWFSANSNGEAEVLKITFKPKPRMKALFMEKSFSEIAIKGRQSMGNIVTKNEIHRISLKENGESTLGGLKVWFDRDVLRLNYDGRGEYIGEFAGGDSILVLLKNGDFYTSNFDVTNHYENDILIFEKYEEGKVWTAVLNDASQQGYPYIKRFQMENSRKKQNFLGENPDSSLILLTDEPYARIGVTFGGGDSFREALEIEAEEFIGVKSFKAKGKRLTTFEVEEIKELDPIRQPEPEEEVEQDIEKVKAPFVDIVEEADNENDSTAEEPTPDENGQMHLF
ncbi:MAG: DNA gyrase/topoisomerase IV subunit A, partial [Bacteroidales bacterium]|nr:DNA gyrase/topoisomerase IV subunit A [Bacteroidales bacterium]